jgi:hypothetical protein
MTSGRVLTIVAMLVWAAVALTAAPSAFSRHHSFRVPAATHSGAQSCSDIHMRFSDREVVTQSEERTASKSEAPILHVHAHANGGVYVEGWDQETYSVTLCKAVEDGPAAQATLDRIHIILQNGELGISTPSSDNRWAAHLIVRAPQSSALEVEVTNGPLSLQHIDGSLKVSATNGPVTVSRCTGELELTAHNGPVVLEENGGKESVRADNGPLTVSLSGDTWSGSGLEAHASNGPVILKVPAGYRSGVVLESEGSGPFQCRASVCAEGRKTWDEDRKRLEFGSGPTLVHVSTVNGPVSVR